MKYFTELKLSGYKSIQDVTVRLNPGINIFIGPNGSGKSNLLEFIKSLENELPELESDFEVEASWKSESDSFKKQVSREAAINEDALVFDMAFDRKQSHSSFFHYRAKYRLWKNGNEVQITDNIDVVELDDILQEYQTDLISSISYIDFVHGSAEYPFLSFPGNIRLDIYDSVKTLNSSVPFSYVFGLPAFRFYREKDDGKFLTAFKKGFDDVLKQYLSLVKNYSPINGIRFKHLLEVNRKDQNRTLENLQLQFHSNSSWYSWDELSDGTRRLLTIIYFVHRAVEVVLVEEPELGIHPHQLSLLMQFLKEQSREKQIIITTHSPDVLDILNPKEFDSINVVSNKKGITKVRKLTSKQKQKAKDYLDEVGSIGDYWKYSDLEV
jgi:predicted ATP-dependent endonuclease of OLD family